MLHICTTSYLWDNSEERLVIYLKKQNKTLGWVLGCLLKLLFKQIFTGNQERGVLGGFACWHLTCCVNLNESVPSPVKEEWEGGTGDSPPRFSKWAALHLTHLFEEGHRSSVLHNSWGGRCGTYPGRLPESPLWGFIHSGSNRQGWLIILMSWRRDLRHKTARCPWWPSSKAFWVTWSPGECSQLPNLIKFLPLVFLMAF